MKALLKTARNEEVFGSFGQASLINKEESRLQSIGVAPKKKKTIRSVVKGAIIGYSIPAALTAASQLINKEEVKPVNFSTMIGAALGASIARE